MGFEGVFSVLPTPFRGGADIDVESLKRVVQLITSAGVNGVTALGVTGEVSRLNERERKVVVETVVAEVAGRGKVIVGASADGVRTCIEYSREAKALGASAVMVSPPWMLKLNTESVVNHYKALAEAVDLPIVVQGRTGSGKERVARAIHIWSKRVGPFQAINCAALPALTLPP